MSTAKHTPGPWIVTDEDYGQVIRGAQVERVDGGTRFPWRDYVGTTWGHRTDESEANAWLMAAAPEMLEALKAAVEEVDGTFPFAFLEAAHAAIAKAEGSTT